MSEPLCLWAKFAVAVGYPSRVSRKGKASPLEAGRGKYSPPASPERVTAEAVSEGIKGFTLRFHIVNEMVGLAKYFLKKSGNSCHSYYLDNWMENG